jgi:protein phosphatase
MERVRTIAELVEGKAGLRVVGDVQGHAEPFRDAVAEARERNLAVLSLGDLIDRGPDAPGAIRVMLDLLRQGDGELVPGNHDDKLRRWVGGRKVETDRSGLAGSLEQIAADPDGVALARDFAEAVAMRPLWRRAGRWVFVHAAFHPAMLRHDPAPAAAERAKVEFLAARALFGETDGTRKPDGFPNRTYHWLDLVPARLSIVIGHDVVSTTEIVRRRGAKGGEVVHLDTGIDRGGRLSWLDIPAAELT